MWADSRRRRSNGKSDGQPLRYPVPVDVLPTWAWRCCCGFASIHEDAVDNNSRNIVPGSVWWHALQLDCSSRLLCFCFLWHTCLALLYDNMVMLLEGKDVFITTMHVPLSDVWLPEMLKESGLLSTLLQSTCRRRSFPGADSLSDFRGQKIQAA